MDVDFVGLLFSYNDLSNIETYLTDLYNKKREQELIEIKETIATAASMVEVEKVLETAKKNNLPLPIKGNVTKLLDETLKMYHYRKDNPNAVIHFPIKQLNEETGGMIPQLTFWFAGRPGMGKTSLVSQIRETALKNNKVYVTFSFDMSKQRLINRSAARNLRLDIKKINSGQLTEQEEQEYILFLSKLSVLENQWFVYDASDLYDKNPTQKMYDILASVKQQMGRVDAFDVDYIQKIYLGMSNRVQELAYIAKEFTLFTNIFNCAGVIQAQLNREVENRQDKRPRLSDLRESGAIEQEADVVVMIYRQGYYDPNYDQRESEFIIVKNREGETGTIYVDWVGERYMFEERFV